MVLPLGFALAISVDQRLCFELLLLCSPRRCRGIAMPEPGLGSTLLCQGKQTPAGPRGQHMGLGEETKGFQGISGKDSGISSPSQTSGVRSCSRCRC